MPSRSTGCSTADMLDRVQRWCLVGMWLDVVAFFAALTWITVHDDGAPYPLPLLGVVMAVPVALLTRWGIRGHHR